MNETRPARDHASGSRILLAEDNPHDVALLRESFRSEGIAVEIDVVNDGDELLRQLMALQPGGPYGLVVLDSRLPRRSAEEVLSLIRAQQKHPEVPIVVLTTLVSPELRERLMILGVREVLSKPTDLNEYATLVRRIHAILTGSILLDPPKSD